MDDLRASQLILRFVQLVLQLSVLHCAVNPQRAEPEAKFLNF
jgi:hypothetical protein